MIRLFARIDGSKEHGIENAASVVALQRSGKSIAAGNIFTGASDGAGHMRIVHDLCCLRQGIGRGQPGRKHKPHDRSHLMLQKSMMELVVDRNFKLPAIHHADMRLGEPGPKMEEGIEDDERDRPIIHKPIDAAGDKTNDPRERNPGFVI